MLVGEAEVLVRGVLLEDSVAILVEDSVEAGAAAVAEGPPEVVDHVIELSPGARDHKKQ
jgi:hypothetical protein